MKINLRRFFLAASMCMLSFTAVAQSENPFIGTWDLDAANSNFGEAQMPSAMTRTYIETGGGGFMYLLVTISPEGAIGGSSASYRYDGASNSIATIGGGAQTTISYFQVNGRTVEYTIRTAGRTSQIGAKTLSPDSRVLTIVIQNINSEGGSSSSQILRFNRR
ncbi:MAG: hypothetical protein JKY29_03755 [Gammaproteobacteria bacterium]|nr:hypothetical protein [Gammaproteobacteria bacterium]